MIGIEVDGIDEVRQKLKLLSGTQPMREMNEEVATFLMSELQKYPPRKHVSRKAAFGQTFQSDRQRRWFFASLADGSLKIPYGRSGAYRQNWEKMPFGSTNYIVTNDHPAAQYIQGDGTQSRQLKMVGWKSISEVIRRRSDRIRQIANQVYDRWVRKLGL